VENLQEVVFQIPLQPFMAFLFWAPSSNHLQSMRTPVSPPARRFSPLSIPEGRHTPDNTSCSWMIHCVVT